MNAQELLRRTRRKWSVEAMHWLLDVYFSEDACRVTDKNLQRNLNLFRKVALNYVRPYPSMLYLIEPHNLKMLLSENLFPQGL